MYMISITLIVTKYSNNFNTLKLMTKYKSQIFTKLPFSMAQKQFGD
jgi:hypothetical protein